MKKAEDFRQMLGPVDSGFHTVFHKTLEDLQQESRRKPARKRTALYPLRIRIAAAAAALTLLAGAGILGLTRRGGGLDPADPIRGENRYTPQTIEAALAQGSEPETAGGTAGTEILPARADEFDPEKDVVRLPGMLLSYACTLPDGRVVLSGVEAKYMDDIDAYSHKARLECLNTDGTVDWEYTGPEEILDGNLWFDNAEVLKDGTIAVRHAAFPRGEAESWTIQFFTPDGVRLDKTMGPFEGNIGRLIPHPSFLELERRDQEGVSTGIEVTDWDGNLITRIMAEQVFGEAFGFLPGDELVLYGGTGDGMSHARIIKMDGLTDKVLWETVPDYQWPDTDEAGVSDVVKTEDGGYAALVWETKYSLAEDENIDRCTIVKLDANGHIRWVYRDDRLDDTSWVNVYAHGGKLALVRTLDDNAEKGISIIATWVDENGSKLGTTELAVKPEYFANLGSMMDSAGDSVPRSLQIGSIEVFSTPEGLKMYLKAFIGKYYADTNELAEVEGSDDAILIRIPEPSGEAGSADAEKDSFLVRDDQINSAREAIAGAYPELDLLNRAEYGYEGNVYDWGTEVHFLTRNISHGDVQAAVLTDGTVRLDSADREPAGDVNTLFRRYQSAYGRIGRWKQATWVQLAKDMEPLGLNDSDPDLPEGKLLKAARFPEESSVRITQDEVYSLAWDAAVAETEFCVLIDAAPHPVWKVLTMTWPVERLLEIDAETGETVASELCDPKYTPAYALFTTEKNRRAFELKELGAEAVARREVRYAFAAMNEDLEEKLPMPDFDNPEEYDVQVKGRTVRFAGRREGLKTFELELDENGYVARCGITDTVPGSK